MSDNLTVFSTNYTNVTGIKAKGTGNGTLTYIRPTGTKSISENGAGIDVAAYASVDVNVSGGSMVIRDTEDSHGGTIRNITAGSVVTGTKAITANGTYDVAAFADASVNVPAPEPELQAKTATPLTSQQVITADSGYDGLSQVTVSAMPSGSASTPATSITTNPSISVNSSTGLITASVSGSKSVTPSVSAGYVSSGTAGTVSVSGSNTSQLTTQAAKTVTPSTSSQTAVAAGRYTTGAVTVAAMPSGTAGTPTATKGTVSNHAISVTPSVTNTTGYITGGTKTGTAVSVSASELVSGSETKTANGTYDVTNLAELIVNVSGGGGGAIKVGVLRPDAELVQSWTVDRLFVEDDGGTLPSYTTSSSMLVGQTNLSPSITTDRTQYDYAVVQRGLVTPIYSNSDAAKGRFVAYMMSYVGDQATIPAGSISAYGVTQGAENCVLDNQLAERWFYCNSASSIRCVSMTTKHGLFMTPGVSAGVSEITAISPSVYMRGDSTYLNSTAWGYLEDVRYQYVVEVYRVAKTQAGPNGFMASTQIDRIVSGYNSSGGTIS